MIRKLCFFKVLLLFVLSSTAQLKSPEEFPGYKIGTQFTPHWKIVSYFQHVAAALTTIMKL
jgi:hypothetical protein